MAKYSQKAQDKVEKTMHEMKEGTLKSGSGQKVKSREQAIAIGLSEARKEGAKVPMKKASTTSARSVTTATKAPKKAVTKKASAKKAEPKKSAPKKAASKKAPMKKPTAKKSSTKKVATKKSTAKKAAPKKAGTNSSSRSK